MFREAKQRLEELGRDIDLVGRRKARQERLAWKEARQKLRGEARAAKEAAPQAAQQADAAASRRKMRPRRRKRKGSQAIPVGKLPPRRTLGPAEQLERKLQGALRAREKAHQQQNAAMLSKAAVAAAAAKVEGDEVEALARRAAEVAEIKAATKQQVDDLVREELRLGLRAWGDAEGDSESSSSGSSSGWGSDTDESVTPEETDPSSERWLHKLQVVIDGADMLSYISEQGLDQAPGRNVQSKLEVAMTKYDVRAWSGLMRPPLAAVLLPERLLEREGDGVIARLHRVGRVIAMPRYASLSSEAESAYLANFAGEHSCFVVTNRCLNRDAIYLQILNGTLKGGSAIYEKLIRYTWIGDQFVPLV
ncbi:unnamed protein product [Chrysoparadoxa australica]